MDRFLVAAVVSIVASSLLFVLPLLFFVYTERCSRAAGEVGGIKAGQEAARAQQVHCVLLEDGRTLWRSGLQ